MHNLPTFKLPALYTLALMQMAQLTGKTPEALLIESLNSSFNLHKTINQLESRATENQTVPIYSSQLNIIPTGSSYGILLELDNEYWLKNKPYTSLALALKGIKEYEQLGYTQLSNWIALSGEYPVITLKNNKGRAHLWLGQDTACRMWSTSSMKQSNAYKLTTKLSDEPYCTMCVKNYAKIANPKVQLVFDEQNKLISPLTPNKDAIF
ncbi:hypothetical protein E0H77_06640 [Acinetobacter sp. ANC 4633]|uniref:hypothetical protein n=1 Tax=Acinetobacter sp. ANC 4633 TaxID=2529845 RepID=UPI00103B5A64|nr:hypothetical protein [Acinetobacter sp. ANC 4633]TCB26351.1 hypothetical protein E0H77_06640 [Acinetobacter sp. ANC 4633]